MLCELEHPNIARIRDLEVEETGRNSRRCILAMDYVRGTNLFVACRTGRASQEKAVAWLIQVARAIDYAHGRDVLHLDLTPRNIVIDEAGQPKVIDFGLSRIRDAWGEANEANEIDGRSDVFALGAILFFALTNKTLIGKGKTNELLEQTAAGEFPREWLGESLASQELQAVCLQAISTKPQDRFATAENFASALEFACKSEKPIIDPPTRPRLLWVSLALTCVLMTVAGMYWLQPPSQLTATVPDQPLTLTHIGRYGDETQFEVPLFAERNVREQDALVMQSSFSSPKFCFLFAINPDSSIQLLYPDSESAEQTTPISTLVIPSSGNVFTLSDGPGPQAMVLATSDTQMPTFEKWRTRLAPISWSNENIEQAWSYESGEFNFHSWGARSKGDIRPRDKPQLLAEIVELIRGDATIEIQAVFFAVKPALP